MSTTSTKSLSSLFNSQYTTDRQHSNRINTWHTLSYFYIKVYIIKKTILHLSYYRKYWGFSCSNVKISLTTALIYFFISGKLHVGRWKSFRIFILKFMRGWCRPIFYYRLASLLNAEPLIVRSAAARSKRMRKRSLAFLIKFIQSKGWLDRRWWFLKEGA